jgi:alanine racemase
VPAGATIGYGSTHRTAAPTVIATVAIGYGDGYSRAHSGRGRMLVRGRSVPLVGRVCMDLCMLDVGSVPGVAVGDEVVVFGRQDGAEIGADGLAVSIGSIPYETVTALTPRVQRVHRDAAAIALPAVAA